MSVRQLTSGLALIAFLASAAVPAQAGPASTPDRAVVAQKSMLVARILADSAANANSWEHAGMAEGQKHLARAGALHKRAQVQLEKGEIAAADRSLNDAMRLLSKVRNRVADSRLWKSAEQARFTQLVQSIETLELSYLHNVGRRSAWLAEVGDEDLKRVKILVDRAKTMAASGRVMEANAALIKAQRDMLNSYNVVLGTAPLVYDLRFGSAEEEYRYESERGKDYEGLVPVALKENAPTREAVALIERLVDESNMLTATGRTQALHRQFSTAISNQREAIAKLQQALELAGIVVPQRLPN